MVKNAKKLTAVGKAGVVSLAEKRFSFNSISNRISRKIAAGTLAAALLLSPSSALAQDKNPAKTEPPKIEAKAPEKPELIAQNVSNADKQDEQVSNGSSPQDTQNVSKPVTQADVDALPHIKGLSQVIAAEQTGFNVVKVVEKEFEFEDDQSEEDLRRELTKIIMDHMESDYFIFMERSAADANTYIFGFSIIIPVKNQDWDVNVDIFLEQKKDGPVTGNAYVTITQEDGTERATELPLTKLAEYFKYMNGSDMRAARAIPVQLSNGDIAIIIYGCTSPGNPLRAGQPITKAVVYPTERVCRPSLYPVEIIE